MPKENINYPLAIEDATTGLMRPPGPEFSLHWSPGDAGYVQVGVEFNVDDMLTYLNQLRKDSPLDSRAQLYSDILNRADLQRTIRAAKRARDAVFGADE